MFTPVFNEWMDHIKAVSLISRQRELQGLQEGTITSRDGLDYDIPRIKAHINELNTNPDRPLLQLRELLNLQRIDVKRGGTGREPSMKEIEMFQFLWNYYERAIEH